MSARRKARELTLKALYAYGIAGTDPEQIVDDIISPSLIKTEAKEFSRSLFFKVIQNIKEIDTLIKDHVKSWDFSRIASIEKNLLRMGICEFLFFDDIPSTISIDEAIELAKKYADKDSKNFVNAVLDSVLKGLEQKEQRRK
ncbi:MAG: transcription antitermination factor NusB [candidate division Zixibacteria bacterium]|nr:transcription antitermination factor NusB [candidate division Zixibacteria bacterium]